MSEGAGIALHAAAASLAALRVATRLGLDCAGMHVLQSSNNTVVHLPACGLVAKVGTSSDAAETLAREIAIGLHLASRGAEIAPPATRIHPGPYVHEGLTMTFWEFLPHEIDPELDDDELADSLARLHGHLASWTGELPDYRERVRQTGRLLEDGNAMRAVSSEGLALLRARFATVAPMLLERAQPSDVLHGAPHLHNVLVTRAGLRWIDFETCCRGPIEVDFAYLGQAGARRDGVDLELLALAQKMLRVAVATTCWSDPDRHPRLREAAEHHLAALADE